MASSDGSVMLWDLKTNTEVSFPCIHTKDVGAIAVSPNFEAFASASVEEGFFIKLTNPETGNLIWEIQDAHVGSINSLVFSADGDWLASSSSDKTIKI